MDGSTFLRRGSIPCLGGFRRETNRKPEIRFWEAPHFNTPTRRKAKTVAFRKVSAKSGNATSLASASGRRTATKSSGAQGLFALSTWSPRTTLSRRKWLSCMRLATCRRNLSRKHTPLARASRLSGPGFKQKGAQLFLGWLSTGSQCKGRWRLSHPLVNPFQERMYVVVVFFSQN